MPFLKSYAYAPLILLLHGVAASASPDFSYKAALPDSSYDFDKKDYFSSPEVKSALTKEKSESKTDKNPYCLTPSDPGCSNMWYKEKVKENDERIQRYQQNKFYNSHE
ncbi:hypothetical protein [Kosakonia oryziphila]|jgi:hypothetical protein|uniref:Uncharacterized protein n=1 Tax=Kosakonia oryziphila TaxID=1005667 RepID=A0A1C4GPY5_9ENTR|nr:hypothetical protein [Kosakonia oryziphila]SCC70216.1 hypothetical protein GA0061070_11281 [Kosakonia oryziphila]